MELMRNFKQFLYRRNIKDTHEWLRNMGFHDYPSLVTWCNSEGVSPPEEGEYFTAKNLSGRQC